MTDHKRIQAGYCAMKALNIGLRLPTLDPVVARSYATLCLVESAKASGGSKVRAYKKRAMQACDALGELGQLTYTLQAAGVHYAGNARWKDAVDSLTRAADYSHQLRDKRQWEECISHLAHLEYYKGSFEKSKKHYEDAMASAEQRGDKQIKNRCRAGIAAVLIAQGDTAGALEILMATNSYGQLALCFLRDGKKEEALSRALLVKDRFKGVRTKYYVLKAFASTAEVIFQLLEDSQKKEEENAAIPNGRDSAVGGGRGSFTALSLSTSLSSSLSALSRPVSRLSTLATLFWSTSSKAPAIQGQRSEVHLDDVNALNAIAMEWVEKLEQFGNIYPVAKPRALLLRGRFLFLNRTGNGLNITGKTGLGLLRQSLATAKSLQMPYEEGLAHFELAKHASSKPEATRHINQALKCFNEVGAAYDATRCDDLLNAQRSQTVTNSGRSFSNIRRLLPGWRSPSPTPSSQ